MTSSSGGSHSPAVQHLLALAEATGCTEELTVEITRRAMLDGEGWQDELRQLIREELQRGVAPPSTTGGGYMSAREAADHAGVTPGTIRTWIGQGRLQAARTPGGSRWRIRGADLEACMRARGPGRVDLDDEAGRLLELDRHRRKR